MKLRWAALASLLGALGACSPGGGGAAIDLAKQPRTRPGLWLETMTIDGRAHAPSPFCDPGHGVFPRGDPDCSQWRATRAPDGSLHLDAVCAKLGGTFTLHRRITGDLASAYVDDIERRRGAERAEAHDAAARCAPAPGRLSAGDASRQRNREMTRSSSRLASPPRGLTM